jgi:farnesyl diphosphate synthase
MHEFESFLSQNLPQTDTFHPHYDKAIEIMMQSGGKRFRPMLLLAVVKAFQPLLVKSSYHAALAIEALHTYSLIHDDLPCMDDANLRRGVETLHITYDEVTAVLAGDALNTYAFELLAKAPFSAQTRIDLVKSLSVNGGVSGMVLGQAIDCTFENILLDIDQLKLLHTNKTAKLIAASLEMGAIIVDDKKLQKELYDFGLEVGLLFQIQDDILDVTQTSEEAGKTTANDGDKNSFVNLLGLDKALESADILSKKLSKKLESFDEALKEQLQPILEKYLNRHKG